jgi:hypothetical protein
VRTSILAFRITTVSVGQDDENSLWAFASFGVELIEF